MSNEPYFTVGERYRNRKGWYEVLEIQGKDLKIRYESDGMENIVGIDMQKQIIDNMAIEERSFSYKKTEEQQGRAKQLKG